jgi:2-polyprenyl-6-methoxyphenol hydroxylase-like FAD-dependent oxidoreductase
MRDSQIRARGDDPLPRTGRSTGDDSAVPHELQVLVVGDGVGGLVLAGLLLNRGIRPVVAGTNAARPRDGGVALPPLSIATLDELLLDVSVRAAGPTLRQWTLHDPDGSVRVRRESTAAASRAGVTLSRSQFRAALREALPARVVRPETRPVRIDQSGPSVDVEFEDGVSEQFDVVVAADGRCSPAGLAVHERAADDAEADSGTGAVRDDGRPGTVTWTVETDASVGAPTEVAEVRFERSVLTSLPLDAGRAVSVSMPADGDTGRTPTEVAESLTTAVECLPATFPGDATVRRDAGGCDAWRVGRVAFLGDATRAVAPLPGAATPVAIEDASVLADALDRCVGPDDALSTYAARRQRRLDDLRTRVSAGANDSLERSPPPALAGAVRSRAGLFAGYFDADP